MFNSLEEIKSVSLNDNTYKVSCDDGDTFVPICDGNRHYEMLKVWLLTNKLEEDLISIATAKDVYAATAKETASQKLAVYDWMAIREMTGGEKMPQKVKDYMAAVRKESNRLEAMFGKCKTLDSLREVIEKWPKEI